MILGPVNLRRVVRSFGTKEGTKYAAHEVIEGKPRKQAVGEESEDMVLDCYFHASLLNVQLTLAQLRALRLAHEVVTLQSPNGFVWGNFVIESVDVKPRFVMPDGTMVSANVQIALGDPGLVRELVPAKAVAVTGTSAPTRTTPKAEDTSVPKDTITPQQIARRG